MGERLVPTLLVPLVGALAATQVSGQEPPAAWTAEQLAVIDAASTGPVGIENDFDRWERGYQPAWTYWRLGADEVRDRETHMGLVRDVVAAGNRVLSFELTPVDVIVRGDIAILRYNAVETLETPDGGTQAVRYSSAALYERSDEVWRALATNIMYHPPEGS
jgi:hypothetical protein